MRRAIYLLGFFVPLSIATSPAHAQSRAYLGLGVGSSMASFNSSDFSLGLPQVQESADKSSVGFNLFAGAQLNKYLTAELGYVDLGKFAYKYDGGGVGAATIDYKVSGLALSGIGTWQVSNDFSLFGRVGIFASSAKASLGSSSGTLGGSVPGASGSAVNKTSLLVGGGLQCEFSRSIAGRIEYENFGQVGDGSDAGRVKVSLISASLLLLF